MDPSKGEAQPRPASAAPNGAKRANEEEILEVISGVQSQLESLRKAHAERQKALAALAAQRQELESQRGDLDKKRAEIERALGEVNLGHEKIRSQEEALRQREVELAKREARIEAAAERVSEYEETANRRIHELEQEAARSAALREELEEVRRISRERRDQINALEAQLGSGQAGQSEQLAQVQARVDELTAALEAARSTASKHESTVVALKGELERLREESQSHGEHQGQAAEEHQKHRDELVQVDKRAQLAEQRAEAAKSAMEDQRIELERQLRKAQGEATGATDESAKLRFKLSEFERELSEARRELEEQRKAREEADEKLKNAPAPGKGKRNQEIATLREENAELRARLLSKNGGASKEQVEKLGAALKESKARIETLETELNEARARLDEAGAEGDQAEALEAARAKIGELEGVIGALREELRQTREAAGEGLDPRVELRRQRLKRQRQLARAQSIKVRRASEALRDRFQQCEQILQKRAKLAEAHQAIAEKEAKLVHQHARSGALWLVLGMATLLGILAGVSWLIAGRVAPGMYAARAVVVADGGSRTLTADNLDAWQVYHEELATDPRLIETVADRLERRGLTELGTPGELTRVLEAGLETQSPHAGRLEFEFRDLGATHTQRVLDTYVVALASVANANRIRRADGASTRVEIEAEVYPDPLDQTRLIYAGGILGGGVLLSMVFGLLAYRRLASVKAKFERDHRVDVLDDEAAWGTPEQSLVSKS
ncbi:MAG: hypothetical protein ACIARR_11470 [Phycisphaerales bacterium JB059]